MTTTHPQSISSCIEGLKAPSLHKCQFCIFTCAFYLIQNILVSDVVKIQQPLFLSWFSPIRNNQGYGFQLAENLGQALPNHSVFQNKEPAALEEFAVAMLGDCLESTDKKRKTTKHYQNWNRNLENQYLQHLGLKE